MSSSSLAFALLNNKRINLKTQIRNYLKETYPNIKEKDIIYIIKIYINNNKFFYKKMY